MNNGPRTALTAMLMSLLLLGGGVRASALSLLPGELVHIGSGTVKGKVTLDHREFLGIPFAEPATGDLRFRAPQPVSPWLGQRDATQHSNACPQTLPVVGTLFPDGEDCLSVDVYTPPAPVSKNLPVMVWIYGGAYLFGSNAGYDPTPLVTKGEVIVVAVNYRVGPFGFLSLPGLDQEAGTSGNYALLDQQAGLRWVQRNIAAFGGDKNNVTLFGQSAGGNSVCHQVASPLAAGLFQRAIVHSGSCSGENGLTVLPKAEIVARSRAFAAEMGCTDPATEVSCLRGLPQDKLLSSATAQFGSRGLTWLPSIDGFAAPRTLDDAWRTGSYQKMPMIIGGTRDEDRLFVALQDHVAKLAPVSPADHEASVRTAFGPDADAVLAQYPLSRFDSPDLAKAAVVTDSSFACPAVESVSRTNATGARVFTYEFNDVDPPLAGLDPFMPLGNYHTVDLFYLFNSVERIPAIRNESQQRLSDQMIKAWATFARTGSPGTVDGTRWPVWSPAAPEAMELTSAGSRLTTAVSADHDCDFWAPIIG